MVEQALIIGEQILLMIVFIGLGMLLRRTDLVKESAIPSFSNTLLYAVSPAIVIGNLQRPFDPVEAKTWLIAFVLGIVATGVYVGLSVIGMKPDHEGYRVSQLGIILCNNGFMAIPLIVAVMGQRGGFYTVSAMMVSQIIAWPASQYFLLGERKFSLKKILLNPSLISGAIALLLYFGNITLPERIIGTTVKLLMNMNTPLCMMTTGFLLANVNWGKLFRKKSLYWVGFLRLIAAPLIMIALFFLTRADHWLPGGKDLILINVIGAATPVGITPILLAAKYEKGAEYGAMLVALTTLFSVITIPLFSMVVNLLF